MPRFWHSLFRPSRRRQSKYHAPESRENEENYFPSPEDYPSFPPSPPEDVLPSPEAYWAKIKARKFGAPQGVFEDSPLNALYRLYEFFILDKRFEYRNALEAFWKEQSWAMQDVPDPKDENPARYAFLAGCTYLMARSFNQRVKIGLQRGMPSLITPDEAEAARNVPDHLRHYESVPEWAVKVPALAVTLEIPTHDGVVLQGKDDKKADPDFFAKNILLWTPHIFFT